MFRRRKGHTHFCSRTWKEEDLWGLRVRVRGGSSCSRSAWLRGPHTHLSLGGGDVETGRGHFPSAPEPAEHEPHRWREKTTRQNAELLSRSTASDKFRPPLPPKSTFCAQSVLGADGGGKKWLKSASLFVVKKGAV